MRHLEFVPISFKYISYQSTLTNMALFKDFPTLNLLAEEIFLRLDLKSLFSCQLVNKSWNSFLANPRFWFRKALHEELQKYKSSRIDQDKLYQLANQHWLEVINAASENQLDLDLNMVKCLKKRLTYALKSLPSQKLPEYETTSPIFLASELGDLELVIDILKFTNPKNVLEIENAPQSNTNLDHVSIQIDDGEAHPNVVPIHKAAKNGHLEVMEFLIKTFDVKQPNHFVDNTNNTAMIYAAQNGHSHIVKHLMKYPRNPNCEGWSIALQNGHYRSAFWLDKKKSISHVCEEVLSYLIMICFLIIVFLTVAMVLEVFSWTFFRPFVGDICIALMTTLILSGFLYLIILANSK